MNSHIAIIDRRPNIGHSQKYHAAYHFRATDRHGITQSRLGRPDKEHSA